MTTLDTSAPSISSDSEALKLRCAYHAAGHAVAAIRLGVTPKTVALPEGKCNGIHTTQRNSVLPSSCVTLPSRYRHELLRDLTIGFAGEYGEWLIDEALGTCGISEPGTLVDDFLDAKGSCKHLNGAWVHEIVESAYQHAEELVRDTLNAALIEAIANHLLTGRSIYGETIVWIVDEATERYVAAGCPEDAERFVDGLLEDAGLN